MKTKQASRPAKTLGADSPRPPRGGSIQATFGEEAWKALSGVGGHVQALAEVQKNYLEEAAAIWNRVLQPAGTARPPADKRFSAPAWAARRTSRRSGSIS